MCVVCVCVTIAYSNCRCSSCDTVGVCALSGKLKDLGNTILGKFGLSLDNFQSTKDPNTGSYSISFNKK